ncbi:hypothetical protein QJS10_CPA16g00528 [Acorus calamus]|uniref:Uncharacterized protein n=1 Tax=Acorus calamus TaxID=4465 RepID=A0AAV9D2L0_ACOCL|nr:hypothetical protein QJS10_CPA16g00528 [Acorus calamus]
MPGEGQPPQPSQVRTTPRGLLRFDGRLDLQKSEGSRLVLLTRTASSPIFVPVAGGAFEWWQPFGARGPEGMGLDRSAFPQDPFKGLGSGLSQSTPSIHNELGPGSWANFFDSAGRI